MNHVSSNLKSTFVIALSMILCMVGVHNRIYGSIYDRLSKTSTTGFIQFVTIFLGIIIFLYVYNRLNTLGLEMVLEAQRSNTEFKIV